jgi:hypothetical protein
MLATGGMLCGGTANGGEWRGFTSVATFNSLGVTGRGVSAAAEVGPDGRDGGRGGALGRLCVMAASV